MSGSTALQVCSTPYRLTAIARSQSSGSESTNELALSQPALLTRTSTRPNCSATRLTIAWTPWRSVTSARIAMAPGSASAVSFALASSRSVTTTVAPSAAALWVHGRSSPQPPNRIYSHVCGTRAAGGGRTAMQVGLVVMDEDPADALTIVRAADRAGIHSLWSIDYYNRSSLTRAAAFAAVSETAIVGTSVTPAVRPRAAGPGRGGGRRPGDRRRPFRAGGGKQHAPDEPGLVRD